MLPRIVPTKVLLSVQIPQIVLILQHIRVWDAAGCQHSKDTLTCQHCTMRQIIHSNCANPVDSVPEVVVPACLLPLANSCQLLWRHNIAERYHVLLVLAVALQQV